MILDIHDLEVQTHIGIQDWELLRSWPLVFNARIHYNPGSAVHTDNIAETLDYDRVVSTIIQRAQKQKYSLLERLIQLCMEDLMEFQQIHSCTLTITKKSACTLNWLLGRYIVAK